MTPVRQLHGGRLCSRPDCARPAAVCLRYDYGSGTVWLDRLAAEADPHHYDLCESHAARLRVPSGWELVDRRDSVAAAG
ncbi:MAG: DUF3499 family protein [Acidimicrobiia bacterium]